MKSISLSIIFVILFLQSCGCGGDIKLGEENLSEKSSSMFPYTETMDPLSFQNKEDNTLLLTNASGGNFNNIEDVRVNTLCEEGIYIQSEYYEVEVKNIRLVEGSNEFWYSVKSRVRSHNNTYQFYDDIYFNGSHDGISYFFRGVIDQKSAELPADETLFVSIANVNLNGKIFNDVYKLETSEDKHVMYINSEYGLIAFGPTDSDLWVLNP